MDSPKHIVINKNKFVIKFSAKNFDTFICNSKECNASFITSNSGKLTVVSALYYHEDGANHVGRVSQSYQMKKKQNSEYSARCSSGIKAFQIKRETSVDQA